MKDASLQVHPDSYTNLTPCPRSMKLVRMQSN